MNGKMLYRSLWRFGGGWMISDNEHWYGRKLLKRLARRREERSWRRDQATEASGRPVRRR